MLVKCNTHLISFRLPDTDEEFVSCSLHSEVERCHTHVLENPGCIIKEVSSEDGTA